MAYGTKYYMEWQTHNGESARLEIQQDGYSSSSTELQPATTPIDISWGQQGEKDVFRPLRVSDAKIRFQGDSVGEQVEEIFDAGDTEYRVRFELGGSLHWQGYLATDLWKDNPKTGTDIVQLDAIDGLALLEANETPFGASTYTISEAVAALLRGVHDLPLTTSVDWRAKSANIPSDECPFDYYHLTTSAYSGNRREQLEDIAERFLLTIFQAGGRWHLRQTSQVDSTDLKRYVMPTGNTSFGTSSVDSIDRKVPTELKTQKPRSRVQRLSDAESRYEYSGFKSAIQSGSFEENLNGWSTTGTVDRKIYSNTGINEFGTQDDKYLVEMGNGSFTIPEGIDGSYIEQETSLSIKNAIPKSVLQFDWELYHTGGSSETAATRISLGSYFLQPKFIDVASETRAADNGTLPLSSKLPGDSDTVVIPKGAKIRGWVFSEQKFGLGPITLSEPAYGGDDELKGKIDSKIPGDARLTYYVWSDTTRNTLAGTETWGMLDENVDYPVDLTNDSSWNELKVRVPTNTPSGKDLTGNNLKFAVWSRSDDDSSNSWSTYLDNVSAKLFLGEEEVKATTYTASVLGQYGRFKSVKHNIGAGPTGRNEKRIFSSGSDLLVDWKRSSSVSFSGKGIEQLCAEALMRRQRETLDRRTYKVKVDDVQPTGKHVSLEYLYTIGNNTYEVTYLKRKWGTKDRATIEFTEIKDAGGSNLVRTYDLETDSSGPTSSGTSTASGGGGGTITSKVLLQSDGGLKYDNNNRLGVEPSEFAGNGLVDEGSDFLGIASGGVGTPELGSDAVTTPKLATDAVTPPKLDDSGAFTVADLTATNELLGQGGVISDAETSTPDYIAKQRDWQITKDGVADFRQIFADELVVKKFTSDLTQALAGSDFLVKSTTVLSTDFKISGTTALTDESGNDLTDESGDPLTGFTTVSAPITVDDLPGAKGQRVFEAGDWVRMRYYDNSGGGLEVRDLWGTVSNYVDNGDGTQTWDFTFESKKGLTDATITEKSQVLDYGQSGQGIIRRTVEGASAPFSAIETWTGKPTDPSNFTARTIVGNMDAAPQLSDGTDPQGYGLYAGNAYIEGTVVATDGEFNGTVFATDGEFNGTVIATDGEFSGSLKTGDIIGDLVLDGGTLTNADGDYEISETGYSLDAQVSNNLDDLALEKSFAFTLDNQVAARVAYQKFDGFNSESLQLTSKRSVTIRTGNADNVGLSPSINSFAVSSSNEVSFFVDNGGNFKIGDLSSVGDVFEFSPGPDANGNRWLTIRTNTQAPSPPAPNNYLLYVVNKNNDSDIELHALAPDGNDTVLASGSN